MPNDIITTPVWFITGCSTGFGREIAQAALERGDRAVVTARDPASVADIGARHGRQALTLALDVTQPAAIERAVAAAARAFGRVDVLVNNAGYGYMATVEEGEDSAVRALFETNFFGLVNLTKRVLPMMREQRSGHIVNITSIRGLAGGPGSAYYAASKFAVEGLTESLRREVAEFGIRVTAVEPGAFRTDWAGRSLQRSAQSIDAYAYGAERHYSEVSSRSGRQPGDPARAAQAIIALVESPQPPGHLLLGAPAVQVLRAKLAELAAEVDAWEGVARSADFPS